MAAVPEFAEPNIKLPPQALEAEQSVVGGLLLDNQGWDDVSDVLVSEDFYGKNHRLIYDAIAALCLEGTPADVVTVAQILETRGELDRVGGLAYIGGLAQNTPNSGNLIAYARIVRERAVLRKLITSANDIIRMAFDPDGKTPGELVDHAEKAIFEVAEHSGQRGRGFIPIKGLLTDAVNRIEELFEAKNPITGVRTGFSDLDRLTSGLQPSDLIIVAGRPSMGKTSLALNMAEEAALGCKLPVAVFSMEMPGSQLAIRMMSSLGRVNAHKVRTGQLTEDDWPRLMSAIQMLNETPIYIDDTPGLTPLELRARARRLAREHGKLGLIVVDYLQLMQGRNSSENRATEVSEITRSLKILAKELNVPLVALSQLNRGLEQRTDKRPVMADLRESGAIEQDADVIVFIYRDEVYNRDEEDNKGKAEIIVAKQRNGPTGTLTLTFLGEYTRFEDYTAAEYNGMY